MSAASYDGQEAEAVAFGNPDTGPMPAGAGRRAFSVTTPPPLPAVMPRVSGPAARLGRAVSGGSHLTGHLPSLHAARLLAHEDAAGFEGYPWVSFLRVMYGYVTLPAVAVLYLAAWILHRPSRLLPLALIALAAYFLH